MLAENKENAANVNGVPVYSLTDPHLRRFCIGLYIRAGSMYETPERSGITHLLEHTVFRNIKKKYAGRLYELLSENGIWFDGRTYKEILMFSVSGISKGFALGADILLSVLEQLQVTQKEFAAEKQRVLAEIREDDDAHRLTSFADKRIWQGTSLAQSISGSRSNVRRFSLQQVAAFQKSLLADRCFFFCVTGNAGNADLEYLYALLRARFTETAPFFWQNAAPVPAGFCRRKFRLSVQAAEYCRISASFDVRPAVCGAAARDLLYALLFQNDDALMNTALSENTGLIYSYNCCLEQYDNAACISFDFEVEEQQLAAALECAFCVLQSVKRGEFSFDRTLQKVLAPLETARDNAEELNWTVAYENHILHSAPIDYEKERLGRYARVNKADLMRAANAVFVSQNLVLTFKGNRDRLQRSDIPSVIGILDRD